MPYKTKTLESHAIRPLTRKQEQYARDYAAGKKVNNSRFDKMPQVQEAIINHRQRAGAIVGYQLMELLRDCDRAADFAYEKGNSMALVKAFELKAKAAGLLIEKHEVLTVSLKEAMELAKARAESRSQPKQIEQAETQAGAQIRENGAASPTSTDLSTPYELT